MNRKTLIIFFVGLVLSLLIFLFTFNNKLDYLAIGDELVLGMSPYEKEGKSYVDFFNTYLINKNKLKNSVKITENDYHIAELISHIKARKKIDKNNINQHLLQADIITISLGQNEINSLLISNYNDGKLKNKKSIYDNINILFEDYTELLNLIRKINDCDIYIMGFYNPLINIKQESLNDVEEIFEFINNRFKQIEINKKLYYVELFDQINIKSNYIPNYKKPYPSIEGYNYISNQLICKFERKC